MELVLNYEITKLEDKQIVDLSPLPKFIEGRDGLVNVEEYYADVKDLVLKGADISGNPKAIEYLDLITNFTIPHFHGQVEVYDTAALITASPRNEMISLKEKENGLHIQRELVWIDGAETSNGVIILPYDDYDTVYVVKGTKEQPEVIFIAEGQEGDVAPFYEKKEGKTYIHMEGFSGGGGTQSDPYLVSTPQDVINLSSKSSSAWFTQTNNINMSGLTYNTPTVDFSGVYDGGNYLIENLNIKTNGSHTGLFRELIDRGKVINVRLNNFLIENGSGYVGSICGYSTQNTSIENCMASGSITTSGTVYSVGGICGSMSYTSIVERCFTDININTTANIVGGIIGNLTGDAKVNNSYSTGTIKAGSEVGGLVGRAGYNTYKGYIYNCYSKVLLTSSGSYTGGLIGKNNNGVITSSFWDKTVSTKTTSAGGTGKTTEEMKQQSTYVGWDFAAIWIMVDYPELRVNRQTNPLPSDTTPPGEVTITSTSTTKQADGSYFADITWTSPTDIDLASISVYKDGQLLVNGTPETTAGYHDEGLVENQTYIYKITTIDTSGNESQGVEVSITPVQTVPTPIGFLYLITGKTVDSKPLKIEILDPNEPLAKYKYLRIVLNNGQVGIFYLHKLEEISNPGDYPLRMVSKDGIMLISTRPYDL
ncbi:GLUG motif-containing protein [Cytobacillus sp. NCCP-133]|uniref:GLUG motif-containing protein n=1 Tax=Cytobacillus sp. NCCP-133 TaxID=766848 RepID=UPI00222E4FA0|nr:GLUG motif-containing protein [Cytobacillus sp. NCCP-133]GLB58682.1 hypothetical protein NCCP133_08150 [Cytobacillus sp. NCCP-133]